MNVSQDKTQAAKNAGKVRVKTGIGFIYANMKRITERVTEALKRSWI